MSQRFPLIPSAERSPAQLVADDLAKDMVANNPPNVIKDDQDRFLGPYAVLMYNPQLIAPWLNLANNVTMQEVMTPHEKELAVLAVSAVYEAPFISYAHALIATKIGFAQEQITTASKGGTPSGLSESEAVVYQTALELARERKPLSDASWQKAYKVLGREKTAGVAHVVGGYLYVAVLLSVGAIDAPL